QPPMSSTYRSAIFAGMVLAVIFVGMVACSKKNSQPVVTRPISQPTQPAPTVPNPAYTAQAVASQPQALKKVKKPRPTTATYVNGTYGVSFTYPRKYSLKTGDQAHIDWVRLGPVETDFVKPGAIPVAAVELPQGAYPGTDFTSAFVLVSANSSLTSEECTQFVSRVSNSPDTDPSAKVKVGSMEYDETFDEIEDSNGHGTKGDAKYYHAFKNDTCYEFVLGVGPSRDEAKDNLPQVDRTQVFGKLEKILASVQIKPVTIPAPETPASSMSNTPAAPSSSAPPVTSDR